MSIFNVHKYTSMKSFLITAKYYILWLFHNLFIQFPLIGYLG